MLEREQFDLKYSYDKATLVMKQYLDAKFENQDSLVLFRMGDFYELFFEDALIVSKKLGLALAKRGKHNNEDLHMCGVPYHALDNYLNKLVESGYKIAICDQIETAEDAKKRGGYKAVVNRDVTSIITPGTVTIDCIVDSSLPNYLVSLYENNGVISIAYSDLLTSEIAVFDTNMQNLSSELSSLNPKEIITSDKIVREIKTVLSQYQNKTVYQVDSNFSERKCQNVIESFYLIRSTDAIAKLNNTQMAALGAMLQYINITQKQHVPNLPLPRVLNKNDNIILSSNTKRNLEIFQSLNGETKNTLFKVINCTITNLGSRLLHKFLSSPLKNIDLINKRLNATEFFYANFEFAKQIRKLLEGVWDIERLATKISSRKASPKDLILLKQTIEYYLKIQDIIVYNFGFKLHEDISGLIFKNIPALETIRLSIEESIVVDAPNNTSDGGFIKHSYHPRVEQLYQLIDNNQLVIENLKIKYQQQTGVEGLKINYNNVLGFFIEVTSRQAPKISGSEFLHKQTTMNSVRFTTQELQQLEKDIINAKAVAVNLEQELFSQINEKISAHITELRLSGEILANIDVFSALAYLAHNKNYIKPKVNDSNELIIISGRHPVLENINKDKFIPNDTYIDKDQTLFLITGPNMGGKSTFLRQNALIILLAQIGSFVPADKAEIGVADQIHTRVGAGDDLSSGQSTFMVEMLEVASILAQATDKSFIILDEVGRGTSTYDGMSIAQAITEHIHDNIGARCMFATHYHELSKLSNNLRNMVNYTTKIEEEGEIIFTHKIVKGVSNKSYGVHVAELAGLPKSVINRASQILNSLEG